MTHYAKPEWDAAAEKIKTRDGKWLSRVLCNSDEADLKLWCVGKERFLELEWSSDPDTDMPVVGIWTDAFSGRSIDLDSIGVGDITTLGAAIVVDGYELVPMIPDPVTWQYYEPVPIPEFVNYE